jgi:hypothetical protein
VAELAVLAIGLAVILSTNAALVYSSLPSVDQLIQRLGKFDTDAPPEKRGGSHGLGLCVVVDANGVDAVALAATEDVDLVILDVGGVFPRPLGALQIWRGLAFAAQLWRRLRRQPDLHAKVEDHDRDAGWCHQARRIKRFELEGPNLDGRSALMPVAGKRGVIWPRQVS